MEEVLIKPLSRNEIEDVVNLVRENYLQNWHINSFEDKNYISFIATTKDKIVAYICAHTILDEADIHLLVVDKNFRKRKIGEKLLRHLIDVLKSKGTKKIFLEVSVNNIPARNLYEKLGFKEVSVRKNYYLDKSDALIMLKEL